MEVQGKVITYGLCKDIYRLRLNGFSYQIKLGKGQCKENVIRVTKSVVMRVFNYFEVVMKGQIPWNTW